MGAQVVYDQMDGVSGRIVLGDFQDEIGKLRRRTRGRHFGEMNPRLRFDSAENVGRATAFVPVSYTHLNRNSDAGDDGGIEVAQKEKDDHHHQSDGQHQLKLDVGD